MKTRVQKWGNSLALRIPKAFAEQIGIEDSSLVELSLTDGKLFILPLVEAHPSLAEMLAAITDANIHAEVVTDPPQGAEVW
ncbi:MAG: AbrB/MazE/SpoVT family DNA-binding domain-containing protein [Chloroflexi bacterium OHK40]